MAAIISAFDLVFFLLFGLEIMPPTIACVIYVLDTWSLAIIWVINFFGLVPPVLCLEVRGLGFESF
jgi:hypothetical protein